jgi:hypothetical protein
MKISSQLANNFDYCSAEQKVLNQEILRSPRYELRTTMLENFRGLRKFFRYMKHLGFGYSSRQGAKNAKFGQILFLFLCALCVFAGDIPILLVAAQPRCALR